MVNSWTSAVKQQERQQVDAEKGGIVPAFAKTRKRALDRAIEHRRFAAERVVGDRGRAVQWNGCLKMESDK
jgi:hypothetical protein